MAPKANDGETGVNSFKRDKIEIEVKGTRAQKSISHCLDPQKKDRSLRPRHKNGDLNEQSPKIFLGCLGLVNSQSNRFQNIDQQTRSLLCIQNLDVD